MGTSIPEFTRSSRKSYSSRYRPVLTLTARANLPVGAGLGSSASFSVCTATALLLVFGQIRVPPQSSPSSPIPQEDFSSSSAQSPLPPTKLVDTLAQSTNRYAFLAEKILHGTPSGVDNSVAVFGGGLQYTKDLGHGGGMEAIEGFKALRFLLTDTRVPRNTRSLVAGVAARLAEDPDRVRELLQKIRGVVARAKQVLRGENGQERGELAVSTPWIAPIMCQLADGDCVRPLLTRTTNTSLTSEFRIPAWRTCGQ